MTTRVCILVSFVATSMTMAAQTLVSANIPTYPPLAHQARVEGAVKLAFTLPANSAEPTNVEVVSGHPMLRSAAVAAVKSWRFENSYAVERKYETTFEYRILEGVKRRVTFESFHNVEVVTDVPSATVNY